MREEANIVEQYADADTSGRIDILIKYYPNFLRLVEGYEQSLSYIIKQEKEYKHRAARGNLGVRVQTSEISDPTAREAIDNIMIMDAIRSGDLKSIIRDLDEEVMQLHETEGILSPVLVRPTGKGTYEMISGHRRMHAAKRAHLTKIPAIVMDLTDDESTIIMVDANLQREEVLPSERAFSFKMKMDAMRHQGTCRHDVDKLSPVERKTATIVGEGSGLTGRSVQRYIRLTELLPELLEMVDNKQLSLVNGVDIAAFDKEVQSYLLTYIKEKGSIAPAQLAALKKQPNLENLTPYMVMTIMKEAVATKPQTKKVSFTEKKLNKYFPADYSASKREKIIIELLSKWSAEQGFINEKSDVEGVI